MDSQNTGPLGAAAGPRPGRTRRLSARRKLAAVQRLMRGESQEAASRDLNVARHRLAAWRDRALMAAESALKERERDARDDEIARLQAKAGEITMANELLYARIERMEGGLTNHDRENVGWLCERRSHP